MLQAEILNLLNDLKAVRGTTYLLVSHDADVIAHMCERTAMMRRGEIVAALDRTGLARLG